MEDLGDPFDALLASPPAPRPEPAHDRARAIAARGIDRLEGAFACFAAHRDARVLSALVAIASIAAVLPALVIAVALASWPPSQPLVKDTRPKPAPIVVTVLIPRVIVAPAPEAHDARADAPRRRARRRR